MTSKTGESADEELPNGTATVTTKSGRDGFGREFTDMIAGATGPKASPRLRTVFADLVRHLHDFCRDNNITTEEWLAAVDLVSHPQYHWKPYV